MITMKGKFNSANIMIDEIDDTTREQIQGFLNHPAFANTYIAIMPDCHAGKGAVVGFTMKVNDYIIPNIIGVDIGCGMLTANFGKKRMGLADLQILDSYIKENIPSGFRINEKANYEFLSPSDLTDIGFTCERVGVDYTKTIKAMGSLGGGNHFCEVGQSISGDLYVTIHSGSRNFGKCVADYHQRKAKSILEKYFLKDQYRDLEFLLKDSDEGRVYLKDLKVAQEFASLNRKTMMSKITQFMGNAPIEIIESVHNFIDEDNIIRKGATPARLGEKVIIPFNMRDGLAICRGKGSDKYNNSAPHGAGRILSRTKAKATLSLDEFQSQMQFANVFTTTANESTLDEAPGAYKNMSIILDNIHETVDVIDMIKPIYNFKAEEK